MKKVIRVLSVMALLLCLAPCKAQEVSNNTNGLVATSEGTVVTTSVITTETDTHPFKQFSSFGFSYMADFDAIDHGVYGIGGYTFGEGKSNESDWGWEYFLGANWGLGGGSKYEGVIARVGPAYGYRLGGDTALVTSGTFDCNFIDGFNWGLSLESRLYWHLKDKQTCGWSIGPMLTWSQGSSKIGFGFVVGIFFH